MCASTSRPTLQIVPGDLRQFPMPAVRVAGAGKRQIEASLLRVTGEPVLRGSCDKYRIVVGTQGARKAIWSPSDSPAAGNDPKLSRRAETSAGPLEPPP